MSDHDLSSARSIAPRRLGVSGLERDCPFSEPTVKLTKGRMRREPRTGLGRDRLRRHAPTEGGPPPAGIVETTQADDDGIGPARLP
ncbi:protein of unknown function [Methylorubrum extorquens]|uniref:Uncharacterized protein n=1 Tax=Methylorubrum extorquens TaxID=408 RepID=A0A2N9AH14_METEX|nr:protein of unknown function [Methylorubrum extorquens]